MEFRQLLEQDSLGKRDFAWVELNGASLAKTTLVCMGRSGAKLMGAT